MPPRTPRARAASRSPSTERSSRRRCTASCKLKCTDCHADVSAEKLPHAEKLKPVNCATCHDKAVKEYAGTVHGVARKGGNTVAATCTDCHGTHDIKRAKDADSRTNHANVEATCGKCHGNDAIVAKGKLPGGNIGSKFHDSIHGKALKGAAQGSAPDLHELPRRARHPRRRPKPDSRTHPRAASRTPAAAATSRSARRSSRACTASCGRRASSRRPAAPTATARTRSSSTTSRRSRPR